MRITVPVGTRPEVVKLSPVVAALRTAGHDVRCIATGQHTDPRLAARIFAELGCAPDVTWTLEGDEGGRVGGLLAHAFHELEQQRPDAVLVLGDTYTAPLLAMAARRFGVGVVHLEAGLRSFNERSMEESNRRMVAALATIHLAPTETARALLVAEGIDPARIRVVGNPVIDALARSGVSRVPPTERRGILLTAHRATNVDDPERLGVLASLVEALGQLAAPVMFPVHPRTRGRLEDAGLLAELATADGVQLLDPLPYRELLELLAGSAVAVTDSGGLQEEASYLGVPAVVMRSTTPRWEGVMSGAAVVTGLDELRVLRSVEHLSTPAEQARVAALPCPYGDGHTGPRVAEVLGEHAVRALLSPAEPELETGLPPRLTRALLSRTLP